MEPKTKSGEMIGIIAVAAIILGVVMTLVGPSSCMKRAWDASEGYGQQSSQAPATGTSVVGGPSLSASQINTILHNAGSPADGTGQDLYNLSQQYNIDDAFSLAVFLHESNYGKKGVAASSLSLGNLRCIPGAACQGGYAYFPSWQAGYAAFYKLIAGPLYVGAGLNTPDKIMPRYAPSGDSNDPVGYASDVDSSIATWRTS